MTGRTTAVQIQGSMKRVKHNDLSNQLNNTRINTENSYKKASHSFTSHSQLGILQTDQAIGKRVSKY